jgi:hypothetical protein
MSAIGIISGTGTAHDPHRSASIVRAAAMAKSLLLFFMFIL